QTGSRKELMDALTGLLRTVSVAALTAPIKMYRLFVSPMLPAACRFTPTCSAYALEAVQTHGPFKGTGLAVNGLLRCDPISWLGGSSGFDPVPHPHNHP